MGLRISMYACILGRCMHAKMFATRIESESTNPQKMLLSVCLPLFVTVLLSPAAVIVESESNFKSSHPCHHFGPFVFLLSQQHPASTRLIQQRNLLVDSLTGNFYLKLNNSPRMLLLPSSSSAASSSFKHLFRRATLSLTSRTSPIKPRLNPALLPTTEALWTKTTNKNFSPFFGRHHSTATNMSGSTATSRKQPPWRVPEGTAVPKLKLYNSMTRTKVHILD